MRSEGALGPFIVTSYEFAVETVRSPLVTGPLKLAGIRTAPTSLRVTAGITALPLPIAFPIDPGAQDIPLPTCAVTIREAAGYTQPVGRTG